MEVITSAHELYAARQYLAVIGLVTEALAAEPDHDGCVPLLVLRARARFALHRDLEAQEDLRDIIRVDPQCATAYRLLGELAARRAENESAAIFFREALRLAPHDRDAAAALAVAEARSMAARARQPRAHTAPIAAFASPVRFTRPGSAPRFARGTHAPAKGEDAVILVEPEPEDADADEDDFFDFSVLADEPARSDPKPEARSPMSTSSDVAVERRRTEDRFARGSTPNHAWRTPAPQPMIARLEVRTRPTELPGFGDYLVATGILTRERLRAAQAYQRSMRVQLSTAIVTLGLATPQRIEWAAVEHQAAVGQAR